MDLNAGIITSPISANAISNNGLNLAADTAINAYVIGVAGTTSFSIVTESLALTPATPVAPPMACDLTLSGSLVNGSLSAGGNVTYGLTGASPNSYVGVFLAFDNTPTTVFDIPLGIGGGGGLGVVAFGVADAFGTFSETANYAGVTLTTPPRIPGSGGPIAPFTFEFFVQAASVESLPSGNQLLTCLSDIEVLQVNAP